MFLSAFSAYLLHLVGNTIEIAYVAVSVVCLAGGFPKVVRLQHNSVIRPFLAFHSWL